MIIQGIRTMLNQAQPGSVFLKRGQFLYLIPFLCLVLLSTSTHVSSSQVLHFLENGVRPDYNAMTYSERMRYVYALQGHIAQNPAYLSSLDNDDIALILAQPSLNRRDNPTSAWQYTSDMCVLDIYFEDNSSEAIHHEFRARTLNAELKTQECLQTIFLAQQDSVEQAFTQTFVQSDY